MYFSFLVGVYQLRPIKLVELSYHYSASTGNHVTTDRSILL